ncbi:MAG: hypothetical protein JO062_07385 [Bryobacterales bacterium]|nr:hypothetical protein [Bryobacterales bacterium]
MRFFCAWGALLIFGVGAAAQPSIANVMSGVSGNSEVLPNRAIAQGSIFVITGSGLGPTSLAIDPKPFQDTTLAGTFVTVTVGSSTVNVPMYYTSSGKVAALMPSTTPTGTGTVAVTYVGQASSTAPITVVQNDPGIYTFTSDGMGIGIVTYPDYSLVSPYKAANCGGPDTFCGAANPGDVLTIWANGLGPVNNELSGGGLGVPMNLQLTVWLGGQSITPTYQGRSGCCISEDQIVFTVPSGVPTGCAVPLALKVGSTISNYTAIPVSNGSRSCTPASPMLTSSVVQTLTSSSAPINYGQISLRRQLASAGNGLQYADVATGSFAKVTVDPAEVGQVQPLLLSYLDTEPLGTCVVANSLTGSSSPAWISTTNGIDAGRITVAGPAGSQILTEHAGFGQPTQYVATLSASGTYLSGGKYTVLAAGGNDVQSFNTGFTVTSTPSWPSSEQFTVSNGVNRTNGVTINWINGSENYFVEIAGRGATDNTLTTGASFSCVVPSSLNTFTVPPSVLLAMPSSAYGEIDFKPTLVPVPISASGLTFGSVTLNYQTTLFPPYQ